MTSPKGDHSLSNLNKTERQRITDTRNSSHIHPERLYNGGVNHQEQSYDHDITRRNVQTIRDFVTHHGGAFGFTEIPEKIYEYQQTQPDEDFRMYSSTSAYNLSSPMELSLQTQLSTVDAEPLNTRLPKAQYHLDTTIPLESSTLLSEALILSQDAQSSVDDSSKRKEASVDMINERIIVSEKFMDTRHDSYRKLLRALTEGATVDIQRVRQYEANAKDKLDSLSQAIRAMDQKLLENFKKGAERTLKAASRRWEKTFEEDIDATSQSSNTSDIWYRYNKKQEPLDWHIALTRHHNGESNNMRSLIITLYNITLACKRPAPSEHIALQNQINQILESTGTLDEVLRLGCIYKYGKETEIQQLTSKRDNEKNESPLANSDLQYPITKRVKLDKDHDVMTEISNLTSQLSIGNTENREKDMVSSIVSLADLVGEMKETLQTNTLESQDAISSLDSDIQVLEVSLSDSETSRTDWYKWLKENTAKLQKCQRSLQDYLCGTTAIIPSDQEFHILENQISMVLFRTQRYYDVYQKDEPENSSFRTDYESIKKNITDMQKKESSEDESSHLHDYQLAVLELAKLILKMQGWQGDEPDEILTQLDKQINNYHDKLWGINDASDSSSIYDGQDTTERDVHKARHLQDSQAISFPDFQEPPDPYMFNFVYIEGQDGAKKRLKDIYRTSIGPTKRKLDPAMKKVEIVSNSYKSEKRNFANDTSFMNAYAGLQELGRSRKLTLAVKENLTKITGRAVELDPAKLSPESYALYRELTEKADLQKISSLRELSGKCTQPIIGYSQLTRYIAKKTYNMALLVERWHGYLSNRSNAAFSKNPLEAIYAWENLKKMKEPINDLPIAPGLKYALNETFKFTDTSHNIP